MSKRIKSASNIVKTAVVEMMLVTKNRNLNLIQSIEAATFLLITFTRIFDEHLSAGEIALKSIKNKRKK